MNHPERSPAIKTARHHLRDAENHVNIAYSHLERALHRASGITKDPLWLNRFHQALSHNLQTRSQLHTLATQFDLATEPPS